jgi:hypothetical protein
VSELSFKRVYSRNLVLPELKDLGFKRCLRCGAVVYGSYCGVCGKLVSRKRGEKHDKAQEEDGLWC